MKQPTKRLTLANLSETPPPVVLSAEPTDEELRQAIRSKVIATLRRGPDAKWTREDWQGVQELWARVDPKNATREEEKFTRQDLKKIDELDARYFGGIYCEYCGRGTKATEA